MKDQVPDEQTQALLARMAETGGAPVYELSPQEARESRNAFFASLIGCPSPVKQVLDRTIPAGGHDLSVRIYTPMETSLETDEYPILVYFHGGGWLLGSLDTHDGICRLLGKAAGCVVISVQYRLAPENPFPAALEDAYQAVCWAAENTREFRGDASRLAVGGDSSGGNLAAAVSLMARDRGGPLLLHQLLLYPVLDLSTFDRESYHAHGTGYVLTTESMRYYRGQYLSRKEQRTDPYVSPLLDRDLSGLPSATVVNAELDVLTDEGKAYAERLTGAGVFVTHLRYEQMIHPFLNFLKDVDRAKEALIEIGDHMARVFEKGPAGPASF